MKKLNIIGWFVGIICITVAIYIVYNKTYNVRENIKINQEEEIKLLNGTLSEVASPLGWLIIIDALSNQNEDGSYNISYETDLLKDYYNRQLFTMGYILLYQNNYDKFTVLSKLSNELIEKSPTDNSVKAYLDYNTFNEFYKRLFGDNFDLKKAKQGNTSYDKNYVYYDNRKNESNNIYVPMITCNNLEYKNNEYISSVTITYSTAASDLIGAVTSTGIITYSKDIDNNILFRTFMIEK